MKQLIAMIMVALGLYGYGATTYTYNDGTLTWSYTLASNKATLTKVEANNAGDITGALTIPSVVDGHTVVGLGAGFGAGLGISAIGFPTTLETINYGAFANCTALEELVFPDSLTTIGGTGNSPNYTGAFNGCTSLKSIKFGSGLVTIGNGYSANSNNNPDYYAYNGAFGNCSSLETVEFNSKLETIGHHAFSECIKLKALEFTNSLQTIGVNAFYHNVNLSRVEFGSDLRSIGEYAFARCTALATISFAATTYYSLNIGAYAFMNCTYLTTLTLSDAITTINTGAFSGCSLLRRITIPSVISKVSTNVFKNLDRLNEVDFAGLPPENIENAGLPANVKIRYSSEYADEWAEAIEVCSWTNATAYDPNEAMEIIGGDSRYELSNQQSDRSIASITIDGNSAIDAFILTDGKVYDSVLRIVNTADHDVTLTLPASYTYETFEGADPLTIPANSRNLLTITRTEESVFLVSREKLKVIQQ